MTIIYEISISVGANRSENIFSFKNTDLDIEKKIITDYIYKNMIEEDDEDTQFSIIDTLSFGLFNKNQSINEIVISRDKSTTLLMLNGVEVPNTSASHIMEFPAWLNIISVIKEILNPEELNFKDYNVSNKMKGWISIEGGPTLEDLEYFIEVLIDPFSEEDMKYQIKRMRIV